MAIRSHSTRRGIKVTILKSWDLLYSSGLVAIVLLLLFHTIMQRRNIWAVVDFGTETRRDDDECGPKVDVAIADAVA